MDKRYTDEEIVRGARFCMTNVECDNCLFEHELQPCEFIFAQYIADKAKHAHMQDVLNDFERCISPLFTDDQRKAYDVGKSYQALKQLTRLAGEQGD